MVTKAPTAQPTSDVQPLTLAEVAQRQQGICEILLALSGGKPIPEHGRKWLGKQLGPKFLKLHGLAESGLTTTAAE